MFCPKCKSIISKKRINYQFVEFCICPDKLEANYVSEVIPEKKEKKKTTQITAEGRIIQNKQPTKRKFVTIQESIVKPQRVPSDYVKIPLDLRISPKARLPAFWKQQQVQKRLLKQTEELYDRYYRKIEDFFTSTELKFYISFLPNDMLTEFSVDHWGLGFKANTELGIFYAGTKLNDLGSFDSKVLEKESDVKLPYRLFNDYSRKLNFDRLSLGQLLEILRNDWLRFKQTNSTVQIQSCSFSELYEFFKKELFS